MSDLSADLAEAYEARVAATDVELTPAAIRAVVRELGGREERAQVAAGNKELAAQLRISVRTVQRWQKEGGQGRRGRWRARRRGYASACRALPRSSSGRPMPGPSGNRCRSRGWM